MSRRKPVPGIAEQRVPERRPAPQSAAARRSVHRVARRRDAFQCPTVPVGSGAPFQSPNRIVNHSSVPEMLATFEVEDV